MGKLNILIGDITSEEILNNHDLIINPTNPSMVAGAGVSGAIYKKARVDILEKYTQEHYNINYYSRTLNLNQISKLGKEATENNSIFTKETKWKTEINKYEKSEKSELLSRKRKKYFNLGKHDK